MAKVGSDGGGGAYNPFHQISNELATLTDMPEAGSTEAPEEIAPTQVNIPVPPKREVRRRREPREQRVDTSPPVASHLPSPRPTLPSGANSLATTKRFKTTRDEAQKVEAAAARLGGHLGLSMDFSKLTRALWDVYLRHEDDILRNIPAGEYWKRPSNSDAVGLAELDERVADLVNEGLMIASRRPPNKR